MNFRNGQARFVYILLVTVLLAFHPNRVEAGGGVELPRLEEFVRVVSDGEADTLRGIYIPDVFAAWIVSQPENDPAFVSSEENTLTSFELAANAGSIGLLAHNYLTGKYFSQIEEDQIIYLVYGDGHMATYTVTQIERFHAFDPDNVWSNFIDLGSGEFLSASDLFSKTYAQPGRLILQTCIRAGGNSSWGRLFVITEPYSATISGTETAVVNGR